MYNAGCQGSVFESEVKQITRIGFFLKLWVWIGFIMSLDVWGLLTYFNQMLSAVELFNFRSVWVILLEMFDYFSSFQRRIHNFMDNFLDLGTPTGPALDVTGQNLLYTISSNQTIRWTLNTPQLALVGVSESIRYWGGPIFPFSHSSQVEGFKLWMRSCSNHLRYSLWK